MRTPQKISLVVAGVLATVLISGALYFHSCLRKGRADYEAVSAQQEPRYAKERFAIDDGGSIIYVGRGYEVTRLRTIVPYQYTDASGFVVGARLKWKIPIRAFAYDQEHIKFIEPVRGADNKE